MIGDRARWCATFARAGCPLAEGKRGFCFVRQNLHGRMVTTTYGRSAVSASTPSKRSRSIISIPATRCSPSARPAATWAEVLPELGDVQVAGNRCPGRTGRSGNRGPCRPSSSVAGAWRSPTTTRWSGPSTPSIAPRRARRGRKDRGGYRRLHRSPGAEDVLRGDGRGERRSQGLLARNSIAT